MISIMDLSNADAESFVAQFEAAVPIIGVCSASNLEKSIMIHNFNLATPKVVDIYRKFHHFLLVSAVVDTIGVLAANQFNVIKDEQFRDFLDEIKANLAINSFNNFFKSFPYALMHGQDILLFRAIERESLDAGISFFNYKSIRLNFAELIFNLFDADTDTQDYELKKNRLVECYGDLLSSEKRFGEVDFSFCSIKAECENSLDRTFFIDFERFMKTLPSEVYHAHDGKTVYTGKGFLLPCDCGQSHLLDRCQAICDGGTSHFSVYRSLCGKTVSKVVSEGLFRIKGIKVVAKITAKSSLIDIAEQAISSRKKIS